MRDMCWMDATELMTGINLPNYSDSTFTKNVLYDNFDIYDIFFIHKTMIFMYRKNFNKEYFLWKIMLRNASYCGFLYSDE